MKIVNRYSQLPLFESDADTMRQTVLDAVQAETDLSGADLSGADLSGAYLSGAYLRGAYLSGAEGIYAFGPIGNSKRIGYAVYFETGIMFQLGCHWGNLKETKVAIVNDYGAKSLYEKQVVLANSILLEMVKNG